MTFSLHISQSVYIWDTNFTHILDTDLSYKLYHIPNLLINLFNQTMLQYPILKDFFYTPLSPHNIPLLYLLASSVLVCVHQYLSVCTSTCLCSSIPVCVHQYLCASVLDYVHQYLSMCISTCLYASVPVCVHQYLFICTSTYLCASVPVSVHQYLCALVPVCVHQYLSVCTLPVCVHHYLSVCINTQKCMN